MKIVTLIIIGLVLMGCAHKPLNYKDENPKLDFIEYFTGPVDGWGIVYDWRGQVDQRFHVLMDGKIQTDAEGVEYLQLDEVFTYGDGKVIERYWQVYPTGEKHLLRAQAPDVPGGAAGEQQGNAIQWKYLIDVPVNGNDVRLRSNDWMWLVSKDVLLNKNVFRKFGIPVAELQISFKKRVQE